MNLDFLTLPRDVLEERMLNAMARILNCEQYEGFKEMLLSLSNEEFYKVVLNSALSLHEKSKAPTFKDFLNTAQKAYTKIGTTPDNSALNNMKPHFMDSDEVNDVWKRISSSRPNDVICLTSEEDAELMGLWQHNRDASHGLSVPSDIFFANTVPLKDCKIMIDERDLPDGQLCEYRVVIFDYLEEMAQADFDTPIPIGAVIMPVFTGQIILPFLAVRGVDSILSGSVGFLGFSKECVERCRKSYTMQNVLNMASSFLSTWYGIQIALLHPTVRKVFRTPKIMTEEKKSSHSNPRKRKVKYVKTYVINKDDLVKAIYGDRHTINRRALVWYVIGHWRTYASGKKVFIQPYWKGELRSIKQNIEEREREIITGGTEYA